MCRAGVGGLLGLSAVLEPLSLGRDIWVCCLFSLAGDYIVAGALKENLKTERFADKRWVETEGKKANHRDTEARRAEIQCLARISLCLCVSVVKSRGALAGLGFDCGRAD